ncbi:MAG TPA: hypothetical protein VJP02_10880 [Candidatus Sulfotelmatobacter sp.]|nr:hypothetical protein [Candidatus Sulfotelmatobacter sp.]
MRHLSLVLAGVLVFSGVADSQSTQTAEGAQATRLKAEVQKRGIGEKSRVKVRLRNKGQVKGYISKIEDESFEVTDKITGQATKIAYADADRVQGAGLSKGAKIGIIIGVGVAIVVVVFAAEFKAHGY